MDVPFFPAQVSEQERACQTLWGLIGGDAAKAALAAEAQAVRFPATFAHFFATLLLPPCSLFCQSISPVENSRWFSSLI